MDETELVKLATKRVKAKANFWNLLGVWVVISAATTIIWAISNNFSTNAYFWPMWPMIGIGIALLFAFLDAYGPSSRYNSQAAIDREVERLKNGR